MLHQGGSFVYSSLAAITHKSVVVGSIIIGLVVVGYVSIVVGSVVFGPIVVFGSVVNLRWICCL